jgi:hypothetical protein
VFVLGAKMHAACLQMRACPSLAQVEHMQRHKITNYLVGAMDVDTGQVSSCIRAEAGCESAPDVVMIC